MKTCRTCQQPKPASEYHKHSRRSDGLQSDCKPCANRIARERYDARKQARLGVAKMDADVFWGRVDATSVERWQVKRSAI